MSMCKKIYSDERGFLLIMTMVMLVVLTLVGITALDNSVFEIKIAANDRNAKVAFNMADGALFATSKLIEEARLNSTDPAHGTVEYLNFNGLNKTTGQVEAITNNADDFTGEPVVIWIQKPMPESQSLLISRFVQWGPVSRKQSMFI